MQYLKVISDEGSKFTLQQPSVDRRNGAMKQQPLLVISYSYTTHTKDTGMYGKGPFGHSYISLTVTYIFYKGYSQITKELKSFSKVFSL